MSIACIIIAGAKWDAKANGSPIAAASWAPNRLEPRIQIGTLEPGARHGDDLLSRHGRPEVRHQLGHVLREHLGRGGVAAEGTEGDLVGAWSPADAQVDPAREERGQGAELLGDDQGRVVGQHDAAGADPDGRGPPGDVGDDHRGGGAGDAGHAVVLGEPEAVEAPALGVLSQVERAAKGPRSSAALGDRSEIENGEWSCHDIANQAGAR